METIILFVILLAVLFLVLRIFIFLWPVVLGAGIGLFIYYRFFRKPEPQDEYHNYTTYTDNTVSSDDIIDADIVKEEFDDPDVTNEDTNNY